MTTTKQVRFEPTMKIRALKNKNGRKVKVKAWEIVPRQVLDDMSLRSKDNPKAIDVKKVSWAMLDAPQSIRCMEETQYEDSSEKNFALNVFECALDWNLGIATTDFIFAYMKKTREEKGHTRIPLKIFVCVDKKGEIYIRGKEESFL